MSADKNAYRQIADLVKTMNDQVPADPARALQALTRSAVAHIPAADYAGITVVSQREEVATPAASHEYARILDAIQQKFREGPCMSAATEDETFYISDVASDERWPSFRREALAHTPVKSIAAFQLFTTRHTVGALNLYADNAHAFDQESWDIGYIFAAHAAVLWSAVQRGDQFRSALASRDIIGQAKGIIMERYGVNSSQAFDLLRTLSQNENILLADVARQLVSVDHPAAP